MPPQQLSNAQETQLGQASRAGVMTALSRLHRYFQYQRWIGDNNIYLRFPVQTLRQQNGSGQRFNSKHLGEYIAASSPLHCSDGWGFLGRAIHCHALGDFHQARHLAYYAELRAAMSLLASEGVGVFNNPHVVTDHTGSCIAFNGYPTHIFAWLSLKHWATSVAATDLLKSIIRPGGIQLNDWLNAFGVQPQTGVIAASWLTSWGLDLELFSEDQNARNESSYRPGNLRIPSRLDVFSTSGFMIDIWHNCQPDTRASFGVIDRHLLRLGLEDSYYAVFGTRPHQDPSDYQQRVAAMIRQLPLSSSSGPLWLDFLLRRSEANDPQLIMVAKGRDDISSSDHHMQVMSRAALLLRVATGACNALLEEVGFSGVDLSFWLNNLGERRGFWRSGNEPRNITDLWADVDQAIENLLQWEENCDRSGLPSTPFDWLRDCASEISDLGRCERIALWSIAL